MKKYLIPEEGSFYKANLHSHTVLSDGHWSAEQTKQEYQKRGYSVVAYTDHRYYKYHKNLQDDSFIPIAAFEADLNDKIDENLGFQRVKTYHINYYDTCPEKHADYKAPQPPQAYGDMKQLNAFIEQRAQEGFIACYNHPRWSLQSFEDYRDIKGVFAMEIYNNGCEHDGLYGYEPQAYDEILRQGTRLFCLATDDNHNTYPADNPLCDSFGGITMLKMPSLSYQNVITALKNGNFYATTGPQIHSLYIEDNKVYLTCSPVEKIYMATQGRRCKSKVASKGETIISAEFDLNGDEGYIRIDCQDDRRAHAYSNAYFIDNIL